VGLGRPPRAWRGEGRAQNGGAPSSTDVIGRGLNRRMANRKSVCERRFPWRPNDGPAMISSPGEAEASSAGGQLAKE